MIFGWLKYISRPTLDFDKTRLLRHHSPFCTRFEWNRKIDHRLKGFTTGDRWRPLFTQASPRNEHTSWAVARTILLSLQIVNFDHSQVINLKTWILYLVFIIIIINPFQYLVKCMLASLAYLWKPRFFMTFSLPLSKSYLVSTNTYYWLRTIKGACSKTQLYLLVVLYCDAVPYLALDIIEDTKNVKLNHC